MTNQRRAIEQNAPPFTDFLLELFTDPNLFLLYDRRHQGTLRSRVRERLEEGRRVSSLLEYQARCASIAREFWDRFDADPPTYAGFKTAPHGYRNYLRGKVAEYLGVPIYLGLESRVHGYRFLGDRLGRSPALVPTNQPAFAKGYRQATEAYIERSLSSYNEVMPDYERARLNRNRGQYFTLRSQIAKHWSRPEYVMNASRCWRAMNRLSVAADDIRSPYVVFFPHYQPERTSIPEAYGFSQQLFVIRALREALPEEVTVVVKEHPSTFTNQCAPFVRWPGFYEAAAEMENVAWVDIETDTFELVDNALASSTLSGTVATESLLRGVPTVVFGIMKWCPTLAQHHYQSMPELREFLAKVMAGAFDKATVRNGVIRTMLEEEARFAIPTEQLSSQSGIAEVIAASHDTKGVAG